MSSPGGCGSPDGCSSKSPTWFVVFLTLTVIGTLEPEAMVVDVDVGRPVSLTGASWSYATRNGGVDTGNDAAASHSESVLVI